MAVYETSRSLNEGVRVDAQGLISSVISAVISWNDRRITRKALSNLTARELQDIGLTEGDLDKI